MPPIPPREAARRDLRFIDPAIIARLGTMELKARRVSSSWLGSG
jgi:hypothetical protein